MKNTVVESTATNETKELTPYFADALRESLEDVKEGKVSPRFNEPEKALAWLKA